MYAGSALFDRWKPYLIVVLRLAPTPYIEFNTVLCVIKILFITRLVNFNFFKWKVYYYYYYYLELMVLLVVNYSTDDSANVTLE